MWLRIFYNRLNDIPTWAISVDLQGVVLSQKLALNLPGICQSWSMKLFTCGNCGNLLYFENSVCLGCGHTVGFDAIQLDLITITNKGEDVRNGGSSYKLCANASFGACNWLIAVDSSSSFCRACELNRTIPTLTDQNFEHWKRIEVAKHRLIYSLLRLNLPFYPKQEDNDDGLAFNFLADVAPGTRTLTGHDNGVITLNIEEADEAERVRNKLDLGEKYRTLLGHFRHEVGHYYWNVLIKNNSLHEGFREMFGNENQDYQNALNTYYIQGPRQDWPHHFISPYATSHPWEDWAESWAHYLHMMDTLETAYYFELGVHTEKLMTRTNGNAKINHDPYTLPEFGQVFDHWLPLTHAVNSLSRSMGHEDFYPFVIAPGVVRKLEFIHRICRSLLVS